MQLSLSICDTNDLRTFTASTGQHKKHWPQPVQLFSTTETDILPLRLESLSDYQFSKSINQIYAILR